MKMHAASLTLVTLACLLLTVPAVAGPIQFQSNPASGNEFAAGSSEIQYPGADFLSTLRSSAPSGSESSAPSTGSPLVNNSLGSDHLIGPGGPPDPPIPIPVSEPSGILVILGSGLFGVLGIWRRNSNA